MKRTTALTFIAVAAATPQLAMAQTQPALGAGGVPEDSATPVLYGIQSGAFRRAGINVDLSAQGSGAAGNRASFR
jgi:ABC-type nitrate/sulfonate/bicarbonate transport system substrate-binding protein